MGTVMVLAAVDLMLLFISGAFFNLWQQEKRAKDVWKDGYRSLAQKMTKREDPPAYPKQSLTQTPAKPQDKPKVLNGAEARAYVQGVNAPYFSADRKRANSDVMKENANG